MNAISSACPCLSPQEERLQEKIQGKENHFRKTHPRVFRLLERFDGQKPRIDIERALYFTESMRQTEGEHLTLRWAKALMHIAKNISVCVQEDQLLLGRLARGRLHQGDLLLLFLFREEVCVFDPAQGEFIGRLVQRERVVHAGDGDLHPPPQWRRSAPQALPAHSRSTA